MDKSKVSQFAEQVFKDLAGTMTAGLAYLGVKTGLFSTMAGKGAMTLDQVVEASGLQPRYVEEWLAGMVSAGYLDYDPDGLTYTLPEEHAYLLASEGTDHFVGGLYYAMPAMLSVAPKVARSFREGGGVRFDDFPEENLVALDLINRGAYEHRLVHPWLEEIPEAVAALSNGGRALDVGCGVGKVSITLAKAFPSASFVGVDTHAASIARAQESAQAEGVASQVSFVAGTLDALPAGDRFDLITACDCIHDFAEPEATLGRIRDRLLSGGTLFVIEPKVADELENNRNPIATLFYGFSVFHCMTQSLANGGPGLGTCLGPARTEALLRSAGFSEFRPLPIKSHVNLFYAVKG